MDFETLGIVGVAAITVICYLVGLIVKATPFQNNQLIPIVCGGVGLILGLVCFFAGLDVLPALAATGIDQVKKQLKNGGDL